MLLLQRMLDAKSYPGRKLVLSAIADNPLVTQEDRDWATKQIEADEEAVKALRKEKADAEKFAADLAVEVKLANEKRLEMSDDHDKLESAYEAKVAELAAAYTALDDADARLRSLGGGSAVAEAGVLPSEEVETAASDLLCDAESPSECGRLALRVLLGRRGEKKDAKRGRMLLDQACPPTGMIDPPACANLGAALNNGTYGFEVDHDAAFSPLVRACDANYGRGCSNLAYAYKRGFGVERSNRKAASLYAKACKLGYEPACDHSKG